MFADKSLNILKNIVILMGITLIIGVILAFRLVATKLNDSDCNLQEIKLPDQINHMSVNNGKIFLHSRNKIIYFDYCKKGEIKEIKINQ